MALALYLRNDLLDLLRASRRDGHACACVGEPVGDHAAYAVAPARHDSDSPRERESVKAETGDLLRVREGLRHRLEPALATEDAPQVGHLTDVLDVVVQNGAEPRSDRLRRPVRHRGRYGLRQIVRGELLDDRRRLLATASK